MNQRGGGASEAAKYGAKAVLVRSMGSNPEDYPHTGGLRYAPNLAKIPAFAISTRHADILSKLLNEENGLRGGLKYAEMAAKNKEKHIAAIESDRGGFTPRGFTISADTATRKKIQRWKPLLEPYGLSDFSQEGGGADIGPLAQPGVALIGFLPDSQPYFSLHHTREDTFDKADKRELELGAASMAALVYLIDRYELR